MGRGKRAKKILCHLKKFWQIKLEYKNTLVYKYILVTRYLNLFPQKELSPMHSVYTEENKEHPFEQKKYLS